MLKYKLKTKQFLLLSIAWTAAFSVTWFVLYCALVPNLKEMGLNDETILINLHTGNYYGQNIMVAFLILPFIYSLSKILDYEKPEIFTRQKSRTSIMIRILLVCSIVSLAFVASHEMVDIMGVISTFGKESIKRISYFKNIILNALAMFIFYFRVCTIFLLFYSLLTGKLRSIILAYMVYFVEAKFFPSLTFWRPWEDGFPITEMIVNGIDVTEYIVIIIRSLVLTITLVLIDIWLLGKKDMLNNEKL